MRVRWFHRATSDLEGIADYLQENAPEHAQRIVTEIYNASLSLGQMPYLGSLEAFGEGRRLVVAENYLMSYRIRNETVVILRIRHTARKPLKGM